MPPNDLTLQAQEQQKVRALQSIAKSLEAIATHLAGIRTDTHKLTTRT